MDSVSRKPENIDEYHAQFPSEVQKILEKLRQTIRKAAPKAEECISYGMPAFRQEGMLVYYAAWKEHIGLYPASQMKGVFDAELDTFERSKGTIRFPLEKPLPLPLIAEIVKFRVHENNEKASLKKTVKKKK